MWSVIPSPPPPNPASGDFRFVQLFKGQTLRVLELSRLFVGWSRSYRINLEVADKTSSATAAPRINLNRRISAKPKKLKSILLTKPNQAQTQPFSQFHPPGWSSQSAPVILEQPADLVVPRGDPVTLNCKVSGSPLPRVEWWREGHLVRTAREDPTSHRILLPEG